VNKITIFDKNPKIFSKNKPLKTFRSIKNIFSLTYKSIHFFHHNPYEYSINFQGNSIFMRRLCKNLQNSLVPKVCRYKSRRQELIKQILIKI
jgi:hypothetical protein